MTTTVRPKLVHLTSAGFSAETDPNAQNIDPYNSDRVVENPLYFGTAIILRSIAGSGTSLTDRAWVYSDVHKVWVPATALGTLTIASGFAAGALTGFRRFRTFMQIQAVSGTITDYWYGYS